MIIAAGETNIYVLLVMAAIGLINWLANRKSEEKPTPPAAPRPPRNPSERRGGPVDAEDERMRRFLEALGVPTDSAQRPVPPIVAAPPPVKRPKTPKAPKAPKHRPPPLPAERAVSLDELPAPSRRVEEIEVPALAVPEYETVSSRIGATPNYRAEETVAARPSLGDLVRGEIGSPAQLRRAFVLREVLGPPKGVQF